MSHQPNNHSVEPEQLILREEGHHSGHTAASAPREQTRRTPRPSRWHILLALIVLAAAITAGFLWDLRHAGGAYLGAFMLAASLPLGAAAVIMTAHATGGRWGRVLMPILEPFAASAWLVALLAIPAVVSSIRVFPWAARSASGPQERPYFDPIFVALRAAAFLLVWAVGGPLIAALSRRSHLVPRARPAVRVACVAGLVVYCLTVTFASIDWAASVQAEWASSVFGLIAITAQALLALAVGLTTYSLARAARPATRLRVLVLRDIGNLTLALVILHTYMHFSQFFIIWNGNARERTPWYEDRVHGVWGAVVVGLAVFQFAVPLWCLLFRAVKARAWAMAALGVLLAASTVAEWAWLVLPSLGPTPQPLGEIGALIGLYLAFAALATAAWLALVRRIHARHPAPHLGSRLAQEAAA